MDKINKPIYNPVSTVAPKPLLSNSRMDDGESYNEEHENDLANKIKKGSGCYGHCVWCCGNNCGPCCGDTVALVMDW